LDNVHKYIYEIMLMTRAILQHLTQRMREIEAGARAPAPTPSSAALPALEAVLPDGLPGGSLVEVLCEADGGGAGTLALLLAKQACAERDVLVVADRRRCFYPPAAARLGIDLQRTLILHGPRPESLLAALVQALRCPAVGAALGSFTRLSAAQYRALQLAAEAGGGVGILCLPASARNAPSFAAVRLFVTPVASGHASRRINVEVMRRRGGKAGHSFLLEIDHETGDVRLPPLLAAPALAACSA